MGQGKIALVHNPGQSHEDSEHKDAKPAHLNLAGPCDLNLDQTAALIPCNQLDHL
jgi:hypothetical protein